MQNGRKKGNEIHFGYKDHVKCDAESKLITDYGVTDEKNNIYVYNLITVGVYCWVRSNRG